MYRRGRVDRSRYYADNWRGLAPIFPDTFYRLTHYWFAAAGIPVVNDIPVMTPTY